MKTLISAYVLMLIIMIAKVWKQLKVKVLVAQSCPTLETPWTVAHQAPLSMARILEWVAISFSRESSQPWDQTWVSCIAGRFFAV